MVVIGRSVGKHAFVEEELVRALKEQSFGISSYQIVSTSPMKATARVALLEGEAVLVSLTGRGFQVHALVHQQTIVPNVRAASQSYRSSNGP